MVGGILKDQKHFKLESQRSLEAVATEQQHRRAVMFRRITIITLLFIVITFTVVILGSIVCSKISSEHVQKKEEDRAFVSVESFGRGIRGGGPIYGIALATLRDLQKMHGGSLSTLRSLRAVAFELDGIPQLKSINRIERSGETYTLHFDKGSGEQLSFTSNTFIFIDGNGRSHLLTPDNR